MKYKEIKEICFKLEKNGCYFRHPKKDFINILGQETVDEMLRLGYLKDSPKLKAYWIDYNDSCYEYGKLFRKMYNFIVNPKWLWFKVYVLQLWRVRIWWQKIHIACGYHYDWMNYSDVYSLDEI